MGRKTIRNIISIFILKGLPLNYVKNKKKIKKRKMKLNKKAVFFSTDAMIALILIVLSISVIYPIMKYSKKDSYIEQDIISSLSALTVEEIDNSVINGLILTGDLTEDDFNKSILEIIGEFYVDPDTRPTAIAIANSVLSSINLGENVGIWYGEDLLASKNNTPLEISDNVNVDRQIISGIKEGESITGYSARAFLGSGFQNKYFYFGGYVGEGNITARIDYEGTIQSAVMELAINNAFEVYVNGILAGSFERSFSELEPRTYTLPITNFAPGTNTIELRGDDLHISGGFIKIIYSGDVEYGGIRKNYFPGIDGIINFYGGFYVPGDLISMNILLHLKTKYDAFLTIGNEVVWTGATEGAEQSIAISNAELDSIFDYYDLTKKTIPMRLSLDVLTGGANADVVLITDFSGSMKKAINSWSQGNQQNVDCYTDEAYQIPDLRRTAVAQCVDVVFTDTLFEYEGNKLWPLYVYDDEIESYSGDPADDVAIKDYIMDKVVGKGKTGLASALNRAYEILDNGDSSRKKFIILMTDGITTHCAEGSCESDSSEFGLKSCEGLCDVSGSCDVSNINGQCDECKNNGGAVQNLYYSAQRAFDDLDATIYTVGFGPAVADCSLAGEALQQVATIGEGEYWASDDPETLKEIYEDIAEDIVRLSYIEQIIIAEGAFEEGELYSDSYIEFEYVPETLPAGMIMTTEKAFSDASSGSFIRPEDATVMETRVVSYSGPKWTKTVEIDGEIIYDLSGYGEDYTLLGDPYAINIPNEFVDADNTVTLTTGASFEESAPGSEHNKIIYTIVRDITSFSGIKFNADGCVWNIEFEDIEPAMIHVPFDYVNGDMCTYNSEIHTEFDSVGGDTNDALKVAAFRLLSSLDFDEDGELDVQFTAQDLQILQSEISGIPFPWSTEVQVRKWY